MKIQKSSVKSGGGTSPPPHTHTQIYIFYTGTSARKECQEIEVHLVYLIDYEGEFSNEI